MKRILSLAIFATLFISMGACAQKKDEDKSKRPSPPAVATATLFGHTTVSINYSTPSVKGRTIGTDLEPKDGQVWRTGANEATVFQANGDLLIDGKILPKGKYGLFTLFNGNECTIIFNKTWDQWGAYEYRQAADQLRVTVPVSTATAFAEKMNFSIDASGKITLLWGNRSVSFSVKQP